MTCKSIITTSHSFLNAANFFAKETETNPARIPPQTPPAGGKIRRGFAKSFPPENSFRFAESVLKPHALPEYLEGRTPKEKHPFLFQKKSGARKIRNARSVFSFGVAGVLASAWGFLRAYDSIQSHHALRAWHISGFGNGFELGTINTPTTNSTAFLKPTCGTREERPNGFRLNFAQNPKGNSPKMNPNPARLRALVFRRGGGSKSEAILTS